MKRKYEIQAVERCYKEAKKLLCVIDAKKRDVFKVQRTFDAIQEAVECLQWLVKYAPFHHLLLASLHFVDYFHPFAKKTWLGASSRALSSMAIVLS